MPGTGAEIVPQPANVKQRLGWRCRRTGLRSANTMHPIKICTLASKDHGNSMPRIMKKNIAASIPANGTVITQAAAILRSRLRFTSSTL